MPDTSCAIIKKKKKALKIKAFERFKYGAVERSRTSTGESPLEPESGKSLGVDLW